MIDDIFNANVVNILAALLVLPSNNLALNKGASKSLEQSIARLGPWRHSIFLLHSGASNRAESMR